MNPTLYEQLCRRYVSDSYKIPLAEIESKTIPNARRPGLPAFGHQIDLRWEMTNEFSKVVFIAEVKWRASSKIDKPEVSALAKTCQDVGAQKAVFITSFGFTSGAEAAAQHEGISLHVVHPNVDFAGMAKGTPDELQAALSGAVKPGEKLYTYQVIHRAVDVAPRSGLAVEATSTPALLTREVRDYSTRQVTDITTRSGPGPGFTHRSIDGGGPAGPSPSRDGGFTRGGGGFDRRS
ncbi:MAG: restriction endonuclease [Vicinamibacterales bacterium]